MKESPEGGNGEAHCARSFAEREGATLAAVCTCMTGADIAQQVQALAPGYFRDGPVIDASGLTKTYGLKLEWITMVRQTTEARGPLSSQRFKTSSA